VRPPLRHSPSSRNRLVVGDALAALRDARAELEGAVEVALLDPPYNTRANFHHYRDQAAHDLWLEHRRAELEALRPLLPQTGSVWVHLDD
jgi:adenine-specific DNA-methyltransferase